MKHYKINKKHVFEFGEMSITQIRLTQKQYEELAKYFQPLKPQQNEPTTNSR